jgi:hypothetical protein
VGVCVEGEVAVSGSRSGLGALGDLGVENLLLLRRGRRVPEAEADQHARSAARMNEAIAPHSMTAPIVENAYASRSRPRSVVPLKIVATRPWSLALFGSFIAAALAFE